MTPRLLVVSILMGAIVSTTGCATKQFVREELQKSETKVEQQLGRLETDLSQEKARVSDVATQVTEARSSASEAAHRAGEASGTASQAATRAEQATGAAGKAVAKAEEATGKAEGAAGKAGQALTKAEEATGMAGQARIRADDAAGVAGQALARVEETDRRLSRLWGARNKRVLAETTTITFAFDKWELDDKAQTALLELAKRLWESPDLVVNIEGYTDNVGSASYNVELGRRRAETVRRFLVQKGVELHRIQSIGLGTIQPEADNRTNEGRAKNRRVAVKLFGPAD